MNFGTTDILAILLLELEKKSKKYLMEIPMKILLMRKLATAEDTFQKISWPGQADRYIRKLGSIVTMTDVGEDLS